MTTQPNQPTNPIPAINERGLTKREHFAAMAMQAIITRGSFGNYDNAAETAVFLADNLIKKLNEIPVK